MSGSAGGARAGAGAGARGRGSRLGRFLRMAAPDFLLVLVVSVALSFTVTYAFRSGEAYRGDVLLLAAVEAPMLLALFAGSWSKRAVPASVALAVLVAAAVIGSCVALTPESVPLTTGSGINDEPGSLVVFGIVLAVVPAVVYLLSRRAVGLVFLLVLSVVACGFVQFLYREWMAEMSGLPAFLCVLAGEGALFVFQTYRQGVVRARHSKSPSFGRALAYSAAISVACLAVGAGLYYGVVAGLGLTTPEMKPFRDYYSQPIVYYTGTYDDMSLEGDEKSDNTNDQTEDTNQEGEGSGEGADGAGESGSGEGSGGNGSGDGGAGGWTLASAFDASSWNQQFNRISYNIPDFVKVLVPLLLLALVVLAIVLRNRVRGWRLRRIEREPCSYRVWYLYGFLVERYRRLKLLKPDGLTPMEFALAARKAMRPFAEGTGGADFVEVTEVYQRACYSGRPVTEEEYGRVKGYYRAFFKNARRHTGNLKWIWKFWRI